MKLKHVRILTFKSILDSTSVEIEPDITCIVGKNESGKSAFLNALYRLKPANPSAVFSVQKQYPAWLEKRHRREGKILEEARPVEATFELETGDLKTIESRFGQDTLTDKFVVLFRSYDGNRWLDTKVNEESAVAFILDGIQIPADFQEGASEVKSFTELLKLLALLQANGGENDLKVHAAITEKRAKMLGQFSTVGEAMRDVLDSFIPSFLYFDEYSALAGTIKIKELLAKDPNTLNEEERTARALLTLAGTDDQYLLNADYEVRKRELENVATSLTDDVLQYWSTNPELRVMIDIVQKNLATPQGQQSVLDELKLRLWDDRHSLSLPLDERSTGFRWFFSFLAAFSAYEHSNIPLVILLDEPGLGLHAKAQKDFLDFIENRLAKRRQVIYSTHSPFLVQPKHLNRVRLVQDNGKESGSVITSDVMAIDSDTLFPLQSALGYDLVQHLFVSPHNLVVEGTSDFAYIMLMTEILSSAGRVGLDPRWSIVPVGGADLIPTFVALLGHHLEVTVVIDARKEGNQRLEKLVEAKLLQQKKLITIGNIIGSKAADIEDLFAAADYLSLYNKTFKTTTTLAALNGSDAIVSRIARYMGVSRFDHGRPADYFLRHRDEVGPTLQPESLDHFEELFKRVNATL
jgi:ABC-type cobalamin/Fe3+-siderophores transport system ATPase subunit